MFGATNKQTGRENDDLNYLAQILRQRLRITFNQPKNLLNYEKQKQKISVLKGELACVVDRSNDNFFADQHNEIKLDYSIIEKTEEQKDVQHLIDKINTKDDNLNYKNDLINNEEKRQSDYFVFDDNFINTDNVSQKRKNETTNQNNQINKKKISSENFILKSNEWLTGSIIDRFMKKNALLNKRKSIVFDSIIMNKIMSLSKVFIKTDILIYEIMAGPVNFGQHWCLLFIDLIKKTIIFIDPLGTSQKQIDQAEKGWNFFCSSRETLKKFKWAVFNKKHTQQKDTFSCGVFVCNFFEMLCRGEPLDKEVDLSSYRLRISSILNE